MRPGDVIRLTHFEHTEPPSPSMRNLKPAPKDSLRVGFRAPKDKVFVAVLLGLESRDGTEPLDPFAAIETLGWKRAQTNPSRRK